MFKQDRSQNTQPVANYSENSYTVWRRVALRISHTFNFYLIRLCRPLIPVVVPSRVGIYRIRLLAPVLDFADLRARPDRPLLTASGPGSPMSWLPGDAPHPKAGARQPLANLLGLYVCGSSLGPQQHLGQCCGRYVR
jgi:hypothetical protein